MQCNDTKKSKIAALKKLYFPVINSGIFTYSEGGICWRCSRIRNNRCAFGTLFILLIVVKRIKIEIRHQVRFHIIDGIGKRQKEFVEIFFVKEHLMPVIAIIIKPLLTLRYGDKVIISTS